MASPSNAGQSAHAEGSGSANAQRPSLKEYTKERSASSNDCEWLHELVSSDAGKSSPNYLVRVYYKETKAASTTTTRDFGTGAFAKLDLRHCFASKYVRAVTLCHRDSSYVDPEILDLLWSTFDLEVSFMRHHLDYKGFRYETGCPGMIRRTLEEESDRIEDYWAFGGRWNPIRLPSETCASILRLSVGSECLSVCCRSSGVVIALIRSTAVYQEPQLWSNRRDGVQARSHPCTIDLFAATADVSSISHELPNDSSELLYGIVHFYTRLLVLRCYEDYNLRHDPEPIHLEESDRVACKNHPHILAMHYRRLELVKFKQALFGYLGPLSPEHMNSDATDGLYRRNLQSLLTDAEMLLSLYDNTMRIYNWYTHETDSDYKAELASEQLEEARLSKATAISLGKLSNLAFLYLPLNFVCAMLGMNLSIFGQGQVPVWVFLVLVVIFSLLTFFPIYIPRIEKQRVRLWKLAFHLTRRSVLAGFWFLAFSETHSYYQSFEITNSGLAQVLLGYTGYRTKGLVDGSENRLCGGATWGSEAFWRKKVKKIFLAVKELNPNDNGAMELTV